MARKKNLERAIVLGLILSTGVYGSAWAAEVGPIHNANYNNDSNSGNPYNQDVNVDFDNTGNIILEDGGQYTVSIETTDGNITLAENTGSGILLADGITAGTTVELNASGEIIIKAGYGIQANAKDRITDNVSTIELKANKNAINASNIGIYSTGGVDVLLNAESNEIISDGNYGIQATESSDGYLTLNATNGNNTVSAVNGTGIRANGEKVISVNATGNNIVIGGVYGIQNTQTDDKIKTNDKIYTDLEAENNIIYSGDTAIKSDGVGITDIKADQNNNIGFLTNDKGEITDIAQNGINVTEGTVKVTADGNNIIKASEYGSYASGNGSKVSLNAKENRITVTGDANSEMTTGIYAGANGQQEVLSDTTTIDVSSVAGRVIGIHGDNNGSVYVDTDSLTINSSFAGTGSGSDTHGILAGNIGNTNTTANVDVDAINDINIKVQSQAVYDSYQESIAAVKANKGTNIDVKSEQGDVNFTVLSDAASRGISAEENASVNTEATVGNITINVDTGTGVNAEWKAEVSLKAGKDIEINSFKDEDTDSHGNTGIRSVGGNIDIDAGGNIDIKAINANKTSKSGWGIHSLAQNNPETTLNIDAEGMLSVYGSGTNAYGVYISGNKEAKIDAILGVDINAVGGGEDAFGLYTDKTNTKLISEGDINISTNNNNTYNPSWDDYYWNAAVSNISDNNDVLLDGKNINISSTGTDAWTIGIDRESSSSEAGQDLFTVNADENINVIVNNSGANAYGVYNWSGNYSKDGSNTSILNIGANQDILINVYNKDAGAFGLYNSYYEEGNVNGSANVIVTAGKDIKIGSQSDGSWSRGVYTEFADTELNANNITISAIANSDAEGATGYGIYASYYQNEWTDIDNGTTVTLDSTVSNTISATHRGIFAEGAAEENPTTVSLNAGVDNNIYSGEIVMITDTKTGVSTEYGHQSAVYALSGSSVDLAAGEQNYLLGAVYANGSGTNVDVKGKDDSTATNVVRSAAVIDGAGDLDKDTSGKFTDKDVYSALYAEDGAHIDVTGENYIGTYADSGNDKMLERTVWAYSAEDTVGSSINITGASVIGTDRYDLSPNSADVAIAAGTATNLDKNQVDEFVENPNAERSTVTFKYDNFDSGKSSYINGDILAAYAGLVNISTDNSEAGINITGNLLAGNNGILSVDLGKGGVLTGRADDYGNAGYVDDGRVGSDLNGEQKTFYDPAFSSTIFSGGNVGLKIGAGSRWNVTGQSWITSIDTSNANGETQNERATIDLVNYYKDETGKNNTNAHALTVYDFNGDADFIMNLDGNRANSDMLYMKKANGTYRINLIDVVTTDEINSDHNGKYFSGLRFATVGNENSDVTFLVGSYDNGGAFNVEYKVGTDEYGGTETADENTVYNGGSINSGKPGDSMVDGLFGNNDAPVGSEPENVNDVSSMNLVAANNIMLMSEEAATLDETVDAANDATDYNATNHKIIARLGEEISDTGKTILNMSRANYSNAIYMDRLNKRLGEARYINSEEDEGMWVRIRHDRIGKDAAYRSQNTMYELGYDQKQECDNGERRVGMAIDYMHGDTGYDQIAGKGEIDRYGLWLYDTWMGDKGHYADYVAKWGHLSNDFEVYTMQNSDKVTGDYSNNVFSVSAEYGRKKDIGNDWYFEPQVQAQLARVTGADYTTNQGTKVSVDGINSLIGRAGFRLGKDFGEEKQSTVYIKADVLHEFLGDQDVRVLDKSSDNKWAGISYENEGTWYDVGFGFATQMSKNSYAFMDFEKSFGNDNDETYQINVGMQWSF